MNRSYTISKSFESEMAKLYKNQRKGTCAACNYAFELSGGDYIQYLDADDFLSADIIGKQMAALLENMPDKIEFLNLESPNR